MKHIHFGVFCLEKELQNLLHHPCFFPLLTATDPLCSDLHLCFAKVILQLLPLFLAEAMAGHMLHASAFWQLSLQRVIFSSQWGGDQSVISPISFSFSSSVFFIFVCEALQGFSMVPCRDRRRAGTFESVTSLLRDPADRICTVGSATCTTLDLFFFNWQLSQWTLDGIVAVQETCLFSFFFLSSGR